MTPPLPDIQQTRRAIFTSGAPSAGDVTTWMLGLVALGLLLLLGNGCTTTTKLPITPVREPRAQVLPPLPPGVSFAPASAEPTVAPGTGILQAPELYTDPDPMWGSLFIARAYQGPNTILTVEWSDSPTGPWRLVTEWSCWGSEQIILVSTTGNRGRVYMRGRHTPCTPAFLPASAARLSYTKEFTTRAGRTKAARIEGHDVAAGFTLWKVLP